MPVLRNVLIAILLLPFCSPVDAAPPRAARGSTSIQSAIGTAPGAFQELTTPGPGGAVALPVNGLPALPSAHFAATELVAPAHANFVLGVDPDPQNLYVFPGSGKGFYLERNNQTSGTDFDVFSRVAIIEIESTDAPVTNLYAGYDRNNNGKPDASELACQQMHRQGDSAVTRCVVDLRFEDINTLNVWILVEIPEGAPGASYHVGVISAVPAVAYVLPTPGRVNAVTGPGHTVAGEDFSVQLLLASSDGLHFGGPNPIVPGVRLFGALLANGAPPILSDLGADGLIPFAITRTPGGDDVLDALDDETTLVLESGEVAQHRFVDVPGTGTIALNLSCPFDVCTNAVSFYAARADFPGFTSAPGVGAAPPAAAAAQRWTLGGTPAGQNVSIPVTPGRWYIVAQNDGPARALVDVYQAQLRASGMPAPPEPGAYYNPQRAGHGVFLSQSSDQQVLYWYTYDADGSPVWYVAQGTAPSNDWPIWHQPLFRFTWNGSSVATHQSVGDVTLTPLDATDFIFSWHLDGIGGSERFTQLAPSECVPFQGSLGNFTGQWFAPEQSGYGVDVLALPDQQFDVFYFYDAHGAPRWTAGSAAGFDAHAVLTMNQLSGFCPSCAYRPTVPTAIGTLTMDFAAPTQGSFATNLTLAAPLSGAWNVDHLIARLTGALTCGF